MFNTRTQEDVEFERAQNAYDDWHEAHVQDPQADYFKDLQRVVRIVEKTVPGLASFGVNYHYTHGGFWFANIIIDAPERPSGCASVHASSSDTAAAAMTAALLKTQELLRERAAEQKKEKEAAA